MRPLVLALLGALPSAALAGEPTALQTTLRHATVTVEEGRPTLLAGTRGAITLTVSPAPGGGLSWSPASGPLSVRVTAPEDSGVSVDAGGDRGPVAPGDEAVLELPAPAGGEGPVRLEIPYEVSPRVRVRDYALRLTLTAPLGTARGDRILDSGAVRVPVRVETPLGTKVLVLIVIALAIFLFVVEWVRVDVVAMMMMVGLPLLDLLPSKATFTGLSSNAVVAIIGVMIVSAGLNKVGLVSQVMRPVIRLAGKSASRLMISLSALIAVISSVMQNTGAAVLFLPGIRFACKQIRTPISSILMPIGMCAILGGTLTMIGTSPLILLNDILPEGMEKFGLLELTPIGAGLVLGGIVYFSTVGRHFLKRIVEDQAMRAGKTAVQEAEVQDVRSLYHDVEGPFELAAPADYTPGDRPNTLVAIRRERMVNIVALASQKGAYEVTPPPGSKLQPGHDICAYGPRGKVEAFATEYGLTLRDRPRRFRDLFNPAVAGTVEAAVSPRSSMLGSTLREVGFRKTFGVTPLALYREGRTYYREMSDIPLQAGDALLLHSTWERFHVLKETHRNFTIVTPLEAEVQDPGKMVAAVICFATALTLMLVSSFHFQSLPYNPIPLSVCLMAGAVGMVLTRVISIREAYSAVDWRTVFLLGGLIPLGMAVDRTGTAEWIATGIVSAMGDLVTPLLLLSVLAVMSSAFCLVISNVGACTLLVPLGVSMASQIGIDPRVAAIVVGLGVSNSFLLPTHQVNALYMGPGDYRTKDYMKIGGIMSLIYVAILVAITYLFYL